MSYRDVGSTEETWEEMVARIEKQDAYEAKMMAQRDASRAKHHERVQRELEARD